jgi:hypothetical protein
MEAFHLLRGQAPKDMSRVEEHVGHGNFRAWAKVTSYLTAEVYGRPAPRSTARCWSGSATDSPARCHGPGPARTGHRGGGARLLHAVSTRRTVGMLCQ